MVNTNVLDNIPLPAVVAPSTACKICDTPSHLCGMVDFARGGGANDRAARFGVKIHPYSGWSIYFYHCPSCGFVFTTAFDTWMPADFARVIYNDEYVRDDPSYLENRPRENAEMIQKNFPEMAHVSLLDYGAGAGLLERKLRGMGFPDVDSFEPYGPGGAILPLPDRRYAMITSFEVFEHHPRPHELLNSLTRCLLDEGVVLFSTAFIGAEIVNSGIERWWYVNPKVGHISFYTPDALATLAVRHGLQAGSFNGELHFFWRGTLPPWMAQYNHVIHEPRQ
jgi:SAM-dependent methyltransferase